MLVWSASLTARDTGKSRNAHRSDSGNEDILGTVQGKIQKYRSNCSGGRQNVNFTPGLMIDVVLPPSEFHCELQSEKFDSSGPASGKAMRPNK